jgi:hypothetical protein
MSLNPFDLRNKLTANRQLHVAAAMQNVPAPQPYYNMAAMDHLPYQQSPNHLYQLVI